MVRTEEPVTELAAEELATPTKPPFPVLRFRIPVLFVPMSKTMSEALSSPPMLTEVSALLSAAMLISETLARRDAPT